jgi:hypothetical protein
VRGHSKDHRDDLPQVVIGMAVTPDGIPIRVWCWPGNASDTELIRRAKDDLRTWEPSRVVCADRGFQSADNRRYLQRAGGHYILAEKIRPDDEEAQAALARQGTYHTVAENLRVKYVVIDDGTMRERFVICHNPEEAKRERASANGCWTSSTRRSPTPTHYRPQNARSYTGSCAPSKASSATCAPPRQAGCGSTAPPSEPTRTSTASSCCEAPTRPCRPRTSRSATSNSCRSSAPGAA